MARPQKPQLTEAEKAERRKRNQAILKAKIEQSLDFTKPENRSWAWRNSMLTDHGFIRLVYFHPMRVSGKLYRASQPAPHHLAKAAKQGIKTIVNLRGARLCGSYALEVDACKRLGLALVDFPVNSRDTPRRETLRSAKEMFDTIEYPALMHCKAGADRVGFMSVLYLHLHEGKPLDEALKQLSWRYGHIAHGKTGMLDHMFDTYKRYAAEVPIDFMGWVENVYDPKQVKESFLSKWWANVLVDKILRRE